MIESNFEFIKTLNRDIYEKLYSAERQSRTHFRNSGHDTREAMEKFIGSVIQNNNLGSMIPGYLELSKKIEMIKNTSLLPDLGRIKFKYENGREAEEDYYDFLRKLGNTCSHADVRPSDVRVSYENIIKCLKGYHLLLRKYYKKRIAVQTPAFDEFAMPILEYHVYDSYVPFDTNRSKCMREFKAYSLDSDGEKAFYAIIRLYNKADLNENFLLRNQKCFTEASKVSMTSVPEGMTNMRELLPIGSKESSFYMMSYIFNREPLSLSETLIKEMALEKRIRLCCRIADCLYHLHTSENPIYHRMLSYESIYVCEFQKEYCPYIIKLDFAKIVTSKPVFTVFKNVVDAKERVRELQLNKYLPPEWEVLPDPSDIDWAKVDIYSLGVLFSDILSGSIGEQPVPIDELQELDISDELVDIIDWMRAEAPESRCEIKDVKDIFDDELRN